MSLKSLGDVIGVSPCLSAASLSVGFLQSLPLPTGQQRPSPPQWGGTSLPVVLTCLALLSLAQWEHDRPRSDQAQVTPAAWGVVSRTEEGER